MAANTQKVGWPDIMSLQVDYPLPPRWQVCDIFYIYISPESNQVPRSND